MSHLNYVTIVGMRFYPGAFKALWEASKSERSQHLYLVAEVDNNYDINAVMLHNGKQKLGSVTAIQAPSIKRLMKKMRDETGSDAVIVCTIVTHQSFADFSSRGSLTIQGKYSVNERLARKFVTA